MSDQLSLLAVEDHFEALEVDKAKADMDERIATHKWTWDHLDWTGPAVGGDCSVDTPIVPLADGTGNHYSYMAPCSLVEQCGDGDWIARVDYDERTLERSPHITNGILLKLHVLDIAPPSRRVSCIVVA